MSAPDGVAAALATFDRIDALLADAYDEEAPLQRELPPCFTCSPRHEVPEGYRLPTPAEALAHLAGSAAS